MNKKEGKVNIDMARYWFRCILEGLGFMHSRNFAHLDIKHENIHLNEYNEPKLADFGLMRHIKGKIFDRCGTLGYMAPEVCEQPTSEGFDGKKADIYSLGVVFYSTLVCDYPPSPLTWPDHIQDEEIKEIIARMLSTNPDDRLSVDELLEKPWFQ
jgi:serine/threonine protein kinase